MTTKLRAVSLIVIVWQGLFPCQAQNSGINPPATPSTDILSGDISSSNTSDSVITSIDSGAPAAPTTNAAASPDTSPPTVLKAVGLYNRGKEDEALRVINAVIQATPKAKNPDAYILRGAIYVQKQLWSQAQSDYE
ncbi:MAG TPA: hypothetical protein VL981_04235, partial [Candidatus Methylacidiphilales bacterium]|nr:hypothetical protein [Candidatus Methylacidiphilales bacterium]